MTKEDLKDYINNKIYIKEKMDDLIERRRGTKAIDKNFIRYAKAEVEKSKIIWQKN